MRQGLGLVLLCCVMGVSFLQIYATDSSRQRRDDGDLVTVTTIAESPYMIITEKGRDVEYTGLIPDMMEIISNKIKLNHKFKRVRDGKYGTEDGSGGWNGMIGEILNGVADMAAAPMTMSDKRRNVLDFTDPFEEFGTVMLMNQPPEGQDFPVDTIAELADQTVVDYGIVRDGVTQNFFQTSTNPKYQKIWEYLQKTPGALLSNVEDGVKKVNRSQDRPFVLIVEGATADYWVDHGPTCNLVKRGPGINPNSFAFAVSKQDNNDLQQRISDAIQDMKRSGQLQQLLDKWKKGKCDVPDATAGASPCGSTWQLAAVGAVAVVALLGRRP